MDSEMISPGAVSVELGEFKLIPGPRGETGERGPRGYGIESAVLNPDHTLTLRFEDGSSYTTSSIRGERGETGPAGPEGPPGKDGEGSGVKSGDGTDILGLVKGDGETVSAAAANVDYLPAEDPVFTGTMTGKSLLISERSKARVATTGPDLKVALIDHKAVVGTELTYIRFNNDDWNGVTVHVPQYGLTETGSQEVKFYAPPGSDGVSIANVAEPTADDEAANKGYVDKAIAALRQELGLS